MPNPIENLAAKSAGLAGAVAARTKGLTGVFVTLAEQHKEAATLLKRISIVDDVAKRQDLWSTIRRELLSHERAELKTVYPMLEQKPAARDISERHAAEADALEAAIGEIDIVGCDSPNFKPLIAQLIALVTRHVQEEENEFFPRAQEAQGKEGAAELEEPFMAARQRIMASMP